jgi:hypothetical protein
MAKITLRSGERVIAELDVPFEQDEAESLRSIHEGDMPKLNKEAWSGSGLIRELVTGKQTLPWGYNLRDRDAAITQILQAKQVFTEALAKIAEEPNLVLEANRQTVVDTLSAILKKLEKFQ